MKKLAVLTLISVAASFWIKTPLLIDLVDPLETERSPASDEPERLAPDVFTAARPRPNESRLARDVFDQTGIHARRVRRVLFHSDALRAAKRGERIVELQLFPDLTLSVQFREPIGYASLRSELRGRVLGSPADEVSSTVHLWATRSQITGEVVTGTHLFRIVYAGRGEHYIIEVDTTRE